MADDHGHNDRKEPRRRPGMLGGAPALAEEGDVAFGGMAGMGVIAAIIVSMLALAGAFSYQANNNDDHGAAAAPAEVDEIEDHDEAEEEEEAAEPDAEEEPEEEAEPTVEEEEPEAAVEEEEPEVTPVVVPAEALVDATAAGIVLSGTVPSEATAGEIRAAAATVYTTEQIDDQLAVVDGAEPFTLTVNGVLDNQASLDTLTAAFGAVSGGTVTTAFELSAGGAVVSALNDLVALEPIQFETGTANIVPGSVPTLDRAVEILLGFPEGAVEVGGHTDSRGNDGGNQTLSQQRADAVVAALRERGVVTQLTAVGYGETRLINNPDDTLEKQQQNRRIEFTVLN